MNKIQGHGIPTKFKAAERGTVYTDLDTGKRYKCLGPKGFINQDAVDEPLEYHWQLVNMVEDNQIPNGGVELPFGEKTSRTYYLNPIEITGFRLDPSDTKYYTAVLEEDEHIKLAEPVIVGESYTVVYDGRAYNATLYEDEGLTYFGRNYYWLYSNPDNLPFGIVLDFGWDEGATRTRGTEIRLVFTDSSTAETHTLEIYKENVEITPLPNKYLDIVETVGSGTLTWDGNTEGLVCVDADTMDGFLVKLYLVSENCPTYAEVCNGGTIMQKSPDGGMISNIDTNGINETNDVVNVNGAVFIAKTDNAVYNDGFGIEFVVPKKGIYFVALCSDSGEILMNVTSLTINGYNGFPKEQVKQEYLPDADLIIQLNTVPAIEPTIDNVSIIKGSISNIKQMIKDQKCPSVAVRFTVNDDDYYMMDKTIKGEALFYAGSLYIGYITNILGTEFIVGNLCFSENGEFASADVRSV